MADDGRPRDEFVVNHVLCFLLFYRNKIDIKDLKARICDYFDTASVSAAKDRLLLDIIALRAENVPHVAKHRPGNSKLQLDVDDMSTLLTFADEAGLLKQLPRYVADRPDQLPHLRVEKGDILAIFNRFEKLESALDDIKRENSALRGVMSNMASAMMSHGLHSGGPSLHSAGGGPSLQAAGCGANLLAAGGGPTLQAAGGGPSLQAAGGGPSLQAEGGWLTHSERSTEQLDRATIENQDPFTVVYNDKHYNEPGRHKRMRPSDSPPVTAAAPSAQDGNRQPTRPAFNNSQQNVPAVVGKSTTNTRIKAAPPNVRKSVFCVSNVDQSIGAEDLEEFLEKELNIKVLTIYLLKNKNLKNAFSSSFRICVLDEDVSKLLNTERLPHGITVRKWVHKAPSNTVADPQSARPNQGNRLSFRRDSNVSRGGAEPPRNPTFGQRANGGMADLLTVPPPGGGAGRSWAKAISPAPRVGGGEVCNGMVGEGPSLLNEADWPRLASGEGGLAGGADSIEATGTAAMEVGVSVGVGEACGLRVENGADLANNEPLLSDILQEANQILHG